MINKDIEKNTVDASKQVKEKFKIFDGVKGGKRVLFLGNSITLHETKPEIGWNHNWGMAASSEQNDYVHIVLDGLKEKFGAVNYCITNVGEWELNFWKTEILESFFASKDFGADIVVVRLGENVNRQKLSEYDFEKYFENFVRYFSGKAEKVIITDLFWEYKELDEMIKNVCERVNGRFVTLSDLGYDNANKALGLFEHEGVALHPGDRGMAKIAERILAAI